MCVVRQIKRRVVQFGGADRAGWLPPDAVTSQPMQKRTVFLDFEIVQQTLSSLFLVWTRLDRELSGDTWHPDVEASLS